MKRKLVYFIVALLAMISFASCSSDDSEGLTRITYYPTITLNGSSTISIDKGSTWVDPGYTSTLNGTDETSKVTISGSVNTSKSGVYTLIYTTMANSDGYNATATRTVIVLNKKDPIEGFWKASADSYRTYNGATATLGSDYEILIINNGDGTYYISDLFGGWYDKRAGYGSNYACIGNVTIADGTVKLVNSSVAGFGDSLVGLTDGTYDAATNTIKYNAEYVSSMHFFMTLTKE